jgi:hypothetical protein
MKGRDLCIRLLKGDIACVGLIECRRYSRKGLESAKREEKHFYEMWTCSTDIRKYSHHAYSF